MEICPKCGLPIPACVCEDILTTGQQIIVTIEKRKFGKIITIVNGLETKDLKEIAKKLKNKLACGGTIKNSAIELQGDHRNKIKAVFMYIGFQQEQIQIN